ncbi:MAG: histidine--tRNA ligase, partial [Flavobacteriaceae bacterium]
DVVFNELGLSGVMIKLNHRKVLTGIAEVIGADKQITVFTTALDKLDKIGLEGVQKEMLDKGISADAVAKAQELFNLKGDTAEQLAKLRAFLKSSAIGLEGLNDLEYIFEVVEKMGLSTATLSIDVTLARGLNYYTGAIFEVGAPAGVDMGSIGGGGRYDDLTGIFGLSGTSGVGISFGLDRIYLVMEELGLFPESVGRDLDVLCLNFGEAEALAAMKLVRECRRAGIKADMYPSAAKIQKQMKYADKRGVPYVVSIGETELDAAEFKVRNMESGEQKTFSLGKSAEFIRSL